MGQSLSPELAVHADTDDMNNSELLAQVEKLAGPQRNKTFRAAAEWILQYRDKSQSFSIVETGCYRGIPADGQSTVIFATIAKHVFCSFKSLELDANHIEQAKAHLAANGHNPNETAWWQGDSVVRLRHVDFIDFLYVDSFDCDLKDPFPSQRHQLAEVGAAYGAFRFPAAILMDDCVKDCHGGKTGMSAAFLKERGWKLAAEGYQLLFTKDAS